ncbi:MAG: DNA polymerase III subunit alpha [Geminicoccaceae bacterium]
MSEPRFVHLRVRSAFSLLEGAVTHKGLADACRKDGMPAVGVTDRANLFGVMQFGSAMMASGIQPVIGAVLPVALATGGCAAPAMRRNQRPPSVVVLVKDETGYGNLLKIMSRAYLEGDPGLDLAIDVADILAMNEGLILLTGGAGGPLARLILAGEREAARTWLVDMREAFGDRLYVEIGRHGEADERDSEEAMLDLAFELDVPIVATNDVHFIAADMHEAHDALICIAESTQVIVEDRRHISLDYRFKSQDEMIALFADLPEAIDNTLVIARRCAFAAPGREPILPPFDSAAGRDEAEELRAQARDGLERRIEQHGIADGQPYRDRLDYELDVIVQMKFPGYFLIVSDFIKWAKEHDIPVGPGRGSGAGSVAAWALQITDLDPLRFGLLFERFLNPERVSMPDFDIDFCMNRRDEVIAYVQEKYGRDRVAAIITFGKLQARAALRDVGRVLGLPFGLVDRISKMVPFNPANPPTLAEALDMEPRLKEARREDPAVDRMIEVALKLEGLPRHASTHAAGIVIGDRPLEELVPLYRDPRSSMPVTQFNMKDVEKAGLVKFDFLGLTTLTMLRLGERLVNERLAGEQDAKLELATLPLDDARSYELLSRAETSGVFQLESGGMRDALRQLKPDCFEDIIAMVSLYRPGPMDNIPRYIRVKHGQEEAEYLHPLLEPILSETNGVIIYQEQVMEIAKQLAGYSLGGADLLRRAMGKKIKEEMDAQRETFVEGCVKNRIDPELASTIFDAVAKFASYGFNKSHAAAYALLAYHTAYLKANHPVEFYAAVMCMEMGNQAKLAAYRQEMARRGIELLPPDVNASHALFAVEDGGNGPGVRFALAAIKGVGRQAMEALALERERGGPFADMFDMVARVGNKVLNRRLLEGLIKAGALDGFGCNRRSLVESIDRALAHAHAESENAASNQVGLFGEGGIEIPKPSPVEVTEWPQMQRLAFEFDVIGFYFSSHPLEGYRPVLAQIGATDAAQILDPERTTEGRPVRLAGVVVGRQERKTQRSRIGFLQLSDLSAQFEVMMFSELLELSRPLMEIGEPLLVVVDARVDNGEVKLQAQSIEPLMNRAKSVRSRVAIALDEIAALDEIRSMLTEARGGGARVVLHVPAGAPGDAVIELPEGHLLPFDRVGDIDSIRGSRLLEAPTETRLRVAS